ncbi:MAG TPA: methyltransferase domain-containing protein [Puia sp.]|nr:methyltransferase domain-containing protein [Puia sp.]
MIENTNEHLAAAAFNKQSAVFDMTYCFDTIIQYKRKRVREHIERFLKPNSSILEINAGTGEDAIYFARRGHRVHATDISAGMQHELLNKVSHFNLTDNISREICSYTDLKNLENKGPYDFIFSNFAGLNCTDNLQEVLHSFSPLLKPKGIVTLVLLPKFCLWEAMLLFRGKFKTAFRRFFKTKGVNSHVEGVYFKCWYYNPSFIIKHLRNTFDVMSLEGLCTIVPPSYIKDFPEKHPSVHKFLQSKEDKLKSSWPWKYIGDYYIISLIKKS